MGIQQTLYFFVCFVLFLFFLIKTLEISIKRWCYLTKVIPLFVFCLVVDYFFMKPLYVQKHINPNFEVGLCKLNLVSDHTYLQNHIYNNYIAFFVLSFVFLF